ncbi:MAG: amidohydrolase [Candidatus Cloacimonadia bacterium]
MKQNVNILILNGDILTMGADMRIIKNGGIAIEGNRIVEVDTAEHIRARFSAAKILDATNHIVMPGFINTHTHAAMVYFRGLADDLSLHKWLDEYIWPMEKKYVRPQFIQNAVELAAAEMILSGITTFADMYFFEADAAQICSKIGIRAFLGQGVFSFKVADWATAYLSLKYIKETYEKYQDNELITICVAPHSIYSCSEEVLVNSKKLADQLGVPVFIHVSETEKEVKESLDNHHMRPVEYLHHLRFLDKNVVIAHGVWVNEDEMKLLASTGTSVSLNVESNLKLASGVSPVKEYLDNGVVLSIGTDGAASNNNLDMLGEMDTLIKSQKIKYNDAAFLSAEDIVRFATIDGAKALGIDDKVGSLEKGKNADIILISMDRPENLPLYNYYSHLVYVIGRESVETVIVNGKILLEKKEFKTIDIDKVKANAKNFTQELQETK